MTNSLATIEHAIDMLKKGKMVILVDDEDRENEGDLVIAAEYATSDTINFMSKYGRGLICLSMSSPMIERLGLPMMTQNNLSPFRTAFTVSIEARDGVSTGISPKDRAHTIQVAIKDDACANDLISPGHVFPLKAKPGGVLVRNGQTEGSVDLVKLAGLKEAAVICEIINEDGTMSRRDDLNLFAKEHNIPICSIKDLIQYRIKHETLVTKLASSRIPIEKLGDFNMTVFGNELDNAEHFALIKESEFGNSIPLVRIHSECITGDVFGSSKCDCGSQLNRSLEEIAKSGGILIYLRQEGRGIGLANKLKAYALQEQGIDTVDANLQLGLPVDDRDYAVAYQILKYFGIDTIKLLTNNPLKVKAIEDLGINVIERISLTVEPNAENIYYLKTKKEKLGHFLPI